MFTRIWAHPFGRFLIGLAAFFTFSLIGVFAVAYIHYGRLIDEKLTAGPFAETAKVFAAPNGLSVGDEAKPEEIAALLRRSGYTEARSNPMGWYRLEPTAIEIYPGPESYFEQEAGLVRFREGKVQQVTSLRDNTDRTQYQLEPELITNLFDRNREKRRLVRFNELPKHLVNAVVSVEDKRFFQHAGFDPLRIIKSAYVDIKEGYHAQGASTLSMQLAKLFWLTPEKTWKRKLEQAFLTLRLEQKLTKEQIFEYYVNQVPLGRRGSFNINGFGEAAQAYLGKDLKEVTVAEAALLAGLVQRPSYTNPIRWPERARQRRNVVLGLMLDNGYLTEREFAAAAGSPLTVSRGSSGSSDAPYFVDLVNDTLQDKFAEHDFQARSYRVYTTLDMNLQREAAEAVRIGMAELDALLAKKYKNRKPPEPQVALVCLDAQTAEVKALVGGRNYGLSQLNRALAKRQPGSVFKPFVYAAALNTGLFDAPVVLTTVSQFVDEPTTFYFNNKEYTPGNFGEKYYGNVTLRQALMKSLNIPTVKIAETVGYGSVAELARNAGIADAKPYPSVALGATDATPVEMAGAYTIFAANGVYTRPEWIRMIRDDRGAMIHQMKPERRQVLDPRVAYLMVNLLESVINSGTGAGARGRGFALPAAGKTGTSRDGWFAGFTTKLICVVYVGIDEGNDLGLEGAKSALPIWTEFMKRAHTYREYRGVTPFAAPEGVVSVEVDTTTGKLAGAGASSPRGEVFLAGTQPVEVCCGGSRTQVASWDAPEEPAKAASDAEKPARGPRVIATRKPPAEDAPARDSAPASPKKEERQGFWGRVRAIFK